VDTLLKSLIGGVAALAALGAAAAIRERRLAVPSSVAKAAADGLLLVKEGHGGGGLTEGAMRRARQLAARAPLPLYAPKGQRSAAMMRAWFRRHQVDQRPNWNKTKTPGWTAWQLWAGTPGWVWVERECDRVEKSPANKKWVAKARRMK